MKDNSITVYAQFDKILGKQEVTIKSGLFGRYLQLKA